MKFCTTYDHEHIPAYARGTYSSKLGGAWPDTYYCQSCTNLLQKFELYKIEEVIATPQSQAFADVWMAFLDAQKIANDQKIAFKEAMLSLSDFFKANDASQQ